LLAPADAGDGLASVEERRRLRMLLFLELDHEPEASLVAVHGEPRAAGPPRGRIAAEPIEPRPALADRAEDLVAQVEDIVLIGCSAASHAVILAKATAGDWWPRRSVTVRLSGGKRSNGVRALP
jgi:hypothetical protein